ncbi:gamma-glutamyl-gamma-aminobutyrate hydrolase family protein [Gammaproteobacteria bacterium AS21]
MKQMTIGVLETGKPPEQYIAKHGTYPDMFKSLLSASDADLKFQFFDLLEGNMPTDVNVCDAWLITGSKFGVYEQHSWIAPLMEFVQQAYAVDVPMVGICFGHQLLAQALGGKVIKSEKGWSLGVSEYQMQQHFAWMKNTTDSFAIQAYHQDQVVELPADTQVIASSDFCPYAALNFNDRAISFQGHPEFDASYTKELLINRRDLQLLPVEQSTQAINDIEKPIQRQLIAQWICDFLHHKLQH